MALSKTDHLWLLLLRTALVFGNFQSSSFCSPGKVLLWCVGSDIVHVTHLQAVCYISSVYPWALQSPTQNITRWNKAGIQVLQMLFSCSDLLSSKDTQVCSALHPYNTCQCTSKIHLLSRGLLSLPPRVSVPLCIYVFKNGNMELKCFFSPPTPFFLSFCKVFFLLPFFLSVAKHAEAVCSLSHFRRKMTLILY